ncbi:MAG: N-6 DNA methylase [Sedimentisphaerales bacterium]
MIPYNVKNNNYSKNKKNSTIYTPEKASLYLYNLLKSRIDPKIVLDPAIGKGSLTNPWKRKYRKIIGVDINISGKNHCDTFLHCKFEEIKEWKYETPGLVICNPPFNGAQGKKLYPEVFLRQIVRLFGNQIPVVMIVPMGMRLNVRVESKRWMWMRDTLEISSIISLPINCFGLEFHTEILVFNVPDMKAHYFLYEKDEQHCAA